ncbi:MAG: hypothetical protein KAJ40_01325 [Alphaproteobacteria bacterium]|nr:hypothetical protein [Alphaproteobacteria bacterium]
MSEVTAREYKLQLDQAREIYVIEPKNPNSLSSWRATVLKIKLIFHAQDSNQYYS